MKYKKKSYKPDNAKPSKGSDARSRLRSISTMSLGILTAVIITCILAITSVWYYGSSFENSIAPIPTVQLSLEDDGTDTDILQRIINSNDPHVVLGVSRDATFSEVKNQYNKLSKIVHPDKNSSPSATRAMRVLTDARNFLIEELKPMPVVVETAKGNEKKKTTKQTSMRNFYGIVAVGGGGGGGGGDGGGDANHNGGDEDGNGMDGSGGGNEDGDDRRRITPAPTPFPTQTPTTASPAGTGIHYAPKVMNDRRVEYFMENDPDFGWLRGGWSWDDFAEAARELGTNQSTKASGRPRDHPLRKWLYRNTIRPPTPPPSQGPTTARPTMYISPDKMNSYKVGGLSMTEAIDLLQDLAKQQQILSPYTLENVQGRLPAYVPRYVGYGSHNRRSTSSSWQSQLNDNSPFLKLMKGIENLKTSLNKKDNPSVPQRLQHLAQEGGLVLNNDLAHRQFRNATHESIVNPEVATLTKKALTAGFRQAAGKFAFVLFCLMNAGLEVPIVDFGIPSEPSVIQLFGQYQLDQRAVVIKLLMVHMASLQGVAVNEALANLPILQQVWEARHSNPVYRDEILRRWELGERCTIPGCSCQGSPIFLELDHIGREGKDMYPGVPPSAYSQKQMEKQRPFLQAICTRDHRGVTAQQNEDFAATTRDAVYIRNRWNNMNGIRRAIQKMFHKACFATDREITDDHFETFDAHHLAEGANVQIGDYVFDTAKAIGISNLVNRWAYSNHFELLQGLFRELSVTRTLDANLHVPIWHFIFRHRNALAARGFVFDYPFEIDPVGGNLVYNGDDEVDDLLGIVNIDQVADDDRHINFPQRGFVESLFLGESASSATLEPTEDSKLPAAATSKRKVGDEENIFSPPENGPNRRLRRRVSPFAMSNNESEEIENLNESTMQPLEDPFGPRRVTPSKHDETQPDVQVAPPVFDENHPDTQAAIERSLEHLRSPGVRVQLNDLQEGEFVYFYANGGWRWVQIKRCRTYDHLYVQIGDNQRYRLNNPNRIRRPRPNTSTTPPPEDDNHPAVQAAIEDGLGMIRDVDQLQHEEAVWYYSRSRHRWLTCVVVRPLGGTFGIQRGNSANSNGNVLPITAVLPRLRRRTNDTPPSDTPEGVPTQRPTQDDAPPCHLRKSPPEHH